MHENLSISTSYKMNKQQSNTKIRFSPTDNLKKIVVAQQCNFQTFLLGSATSFFVNGTLATEEGFRAATLRTRKSYALFVTLVVVGFNAGFRILSEERFEHLICDMV